jgi:hypothetical protein
MSSLNKTKPIQFFYKENGDLKINQIALGQLIKIDKSIAICICVGPYRQGKSFLLNTIFKGSNFGVGHEDEACTEGVWVYQCPVEKTQNQSYTLLIMDVEVIYLNRKLNAQLYSVIQRFLNNLVHTFYKETLFS